MSVIDRRRATLLSEEGAVFAGDGDGDSNAAFSLGADEQGWDAVEARIDAWRGNPNALRDEDLAPPTPQTLRAAICWIKHLRRSGMPAPDAAVVTPDAEIAFDRRLPNGWFSIRIRRDGAAEYIRLRGTNVVQREVRWLPGVT